MSNISCIIPTYNEEPRIRKVLDVVANHPLLFEIIVVDDGSIDNTQDVVREFKNIRLIIHEKNQGKSIAVTTGIQEATGDYVFLLDADLIGLTTRNITNLIEPIQSDMCDVSISIRNNIPWLWTWLGIDYISGERVFPKEMLLGNLEKIKLLPRFGIESFMNTIIIKNKYHIKVVDWKNVSSPYKIRKTGFWKGIRGELKMYQDIFKTIGIFGPISQIINMLRLKVK